MKFKLSQLKEEAAKRYCSVPDKNIELFTLGEIANICRFTHDIIKADIKDIDSQWVMKRYNRKTKEISI